MMEFQNPQEIPVLIRLPFPGSRTQTLTLDLTQTWSHFKSTFPLSPSTYYLSFNGQLLFDSSSIASSGITPYSTINVSCLLLGGGGDGGSTCAESRDCYLKMYAQKKPDKVDPNEQRLSKWTTCALSNEPLKPPCVIDRLGNVFNKEALVKALLAKSLPKPFSLYIKGLKDLIPVQLSEQSSSSVFQCPISGLEFNGKYKFFALSKCGHVLSAKALKEVKSSTCLVCHAEFEEDEKIAINGTEEEVDALRNRMIQLKEKEKEMKAASKVKKPKSKLKELNLVSGGDDEGGRFVTSSGDVQLSGKKHGIDAVDGNGKAEVNVKVTNSVAVRPKSGSAKRFKAVDVAPPNADKKVYASIFTSSRKSDFKETYSCRSLPLGRN